MRQRVHQSKPDRVCQDLEHFHRFTEHIRSRESGPRRLDLFRADDFGERASRLGYHS